MDVVATTAPADSTITLGQAKITAHRTTKTVLTSRGSIMWGAELMQQMPRIAGNADPIHYSQMLPGVQTNGEYRGGINVQGCDNAHTMVSIGGVPIYNANHLLGIFSTFTPSHYPTMTLDKGVNTARHPARLGARLDMQLPEAPETPLDSTHTLTGELECGIISSQGTARIRCSENTLLTLSGRGSYLNLLYGQLLKIEDYAVNYSFADANMTLSHRHGRHHFTFDSYYGIDRAKVETAKVLADFSSRWGNNMQAFHWDTEGLVQASTVVSHSAYTNRFFLSIADEKMLLPSSIDDYTLQSHLTYRRWNAGLQATYYNILEQHSVLQNTYRQENTAPSRQHSGLFSLYADYTLPLLDESLNLNAGLRPSLYIAHDRSTHPAIDPHVSLQWRRGAYDLSAGWALRHQHLFFVGVTDMGLPTDFWKGATSRFRPQWAQGFTLALGAWLPGRTWRIDADAFYKRMHRQQEVVGALIDYLTGDFQPDNMLRPSAGHNYGASIMLSHPTGPLTGWIAYTYTRATRKSALIKTTARHFPASHERPHEFNAVAAYTINPHFQVSTTAVVASGTPFTAPRHFYLLGSCIISEFGEHNANRLPLYCRIDLAGSYKWHLHHRVQQAVNLSIYNATARHNTLFYAICIHNSDRNYHYKPSSFFTTVLPSISYSIRF